MKSLKNILPNLRREFCRHAQYPIFLLNSQFVFRSYEPTDYAVVSLFDMIVEGIKSQKDTL